MPYVDLERLRHEHGEMKQSDLAEILNCRQSHISQMERGKRPVSEEMYAKIEAAFGDITKYITEAPGKSIVQQNQSGDNIVRDNLFFAHADEKDIEIIRLNTLLDAARNEIEWLRNMVDKLSSK